MMIGIGIGIPMGQGGGTFPIFGLNFISSPSADGVTLTRSGPATYFDSDRVLQSASSNVARFDYDQLTGDALGLLIESKPLTNEIRNNTGVGAVAGTPGTVPTNWLHTASQGVSREIVGVYTERGITFLRVRFYTPTVVTATSSHLMYMGATTHVSGVQSDVFCIGGFLRLYAGTLTGITSVGWANIERTAAAAVIATRAGTSLGLPSDELTNFETPFTVVADTAAYVQPSFRFAVTGGAVVDATFDIGLPMMVSGAKCGSPIITSGSAVTRNADAVTIDVSTLDISTRGALVAEFAPLDFDTLSIAQADDGTDGNRHFMRYASTATAFQSGTDQSSVAQAAFSVSDGLFIQGEPVRTVLSWENNNIRTKLAGNDQEVDTSATVPSGLTTFRFGANVAGSATGAFYLRGLEIYNNTLGEGQINAATPV